MRTFLLLLPLCAAATAATVAYTSLHLPPTADDPGQSVATTSLNNLGQVAGYEYTASGALIPVVWTGGVPAKIPMPVGYSLVFGYSALYLMQPQVPAINDAGQVLVPSADPTTGAKLGLLISASGTALIGPAPNTCGATDTLVYGLNLRGQVVGGTFGTLCRVFWIWDQGIFTLLQPPAPMHFLPGGINNLGHVMGVLCLNVPGNNGGCETGPILDFVPGQGIMEYQEGANGINPPNIKDQVTGYVLAGPGQDNLFWMSATGEPAGIPPSGPYAEGSVGFSNPNDEGYVIYEPVGEYFFAIQHDSTVIAAISGCSAHDGPLVALNDRMQFVVGPYLCSPPQ